MWVATRASLRHLPRQAFAPLTRTLASLHTTQRSFSSTLASDDPLVVRQPISRVRELEVRGTYIPFYAKVHSDMRTEIDESKFIVDKEPSSTRERFTLPFSSDKLLRENYLAHTGQLRIGKLLEDLDALAGSVAYRFSDGWNPERPLTIVTASTDTINLLARVHPDRDLSFTGEVIYVGRSSIVVGVSIEALLPDGTWEDVLQGQFTMVAREKATHRAARVNRLTPITVEEKERYADCEADAKRRKSARLHSLDNSPPTDEEREIIHNLFLEQRRGNGDKRPTGGSDSTVRGPEAAMKDTIVTTMGLMHPQDRNIHGKIFGGMLMRIGYETAWSACLLFTGVKPLFQAQDEVNFLQPVEIGSLVRYTAKVVYTTGELIQVQVLAERIDPMTNVASVTNTFNYTFKTPASSQRRVVPSSYEEAMLYIEGMRVLERNRLYRAEQSNGQ